jgi:hypothetical protein
MYTLGDDWDPVERQSKKFLLSFAEWELCRYHRKFVFHKDLGIFMGSFLGLGFWSKVSDCTDLDTAPVFEHKYEVMALFERTEEMPFLTFRDIMSEHDQYATKADFKILGYKW